MKPKIINKGAVVLGFLMENQFAPFLLGGEPV